MRTGDVVAMPQHDSVEDYLAAAPEEGRAAWDRLAAIVRDQDPEVEVRFSYGIPTFFVGGKRLLHSGLWQDHLAIYPPPPGVDVGEHLHGKGTIRFAYADPWPADLVEAIVDGHFARITRGPTKK